MLTQFADTYINGILPKGPYMPCLRMADRALLAVYPRYVSAVFTVWKYVVNSSNYRPLSFCSETFVLCCADIYFTVGIKLQFWAAKSMIYFSLVQVQHIKVCFKRWGPHIFKSVYMSVLHEGIILHLRLYWLSTDSVPLWINWSFQD